MSTRIQKGGTVFRPVAKARPRAAENNSMPRSVSQDIQLASHPLPEVHQTPLSHPIWDISTVVTSMQSTVPLQFSLQDHTPVVVNTTRIGVPIVVSSSRATPIAQSTEPPPPSSEETASCSGPSQVDVPSVERTLLQQSKRKSRSESLTASKKPKKSQQQSTTPALTADADAGEDLDPTFVTMAALCEDTGQGRVSSKAAQILDNHLAWKKSNRDKRARMRVRMEARKYGRNEDDATSQARPPTESRQISTTGATSGPSSIQPTSGNLHAVKDASGQGFDYSQDVSTSRYNVQVRIGPNGETIVDEESLFVDRNAEEDAAEYTHVEESDVTKFVNSATYSKRFRGPRWSAEETELFYNALSQFGENYELISYVLPGRDRKACKNKFKTEDRKNSQRVNCCLNNRKPYDMQTLSRMTGKDFSGPTPEIRAPAALSLVGTQNTQETDHPPVPGQTTVSSPTTAEQVEEVVADISSFDRK